MIKAFFVSRYKDHILFWNIKSVQNVSDGVCFMLGEQAIRSHTCFSADFHKKDTELLQNSLGIGT